MQQTRPILDRRRSIIALTTVIVLITGILFAAGITIPASAASTQEVQVMCDGLVVTVRGTKNSDVLRGTEGRDVIAGAEGSDVIRGGGGDDVICGGPGNDNIDGGSDSDRIFGDSGRDLIIGASGGDRIAGGGDADLVAAGSGDDVVTAGAGNDAIAAGLGNDTVMAGDGDDRLDGGPGTDLLLGEAGKDRVNGGSGTDTCSAEKVTSCEKAPQPANQPPIAGADTATTSSGQSIVIDVLINDQDSDGTINPGTLSIITAPTHGQATIETGPTIKYTPIAQYAGADSFTYRICDTKGACATATVSITVEAPATLLEAEVTAGPCRANLSATLSADLPNARGGQTLSYDLQLRNDPLGACLAPAPTVAGVLKLRSLGLAPVNADTACADASAGQSCVEGLTVWLEHRGSQEGPWTVLGSKASSVADGADSAPAGCPGGTLDGCNSSHQGEFGNVEYPQPLPVAVPTDAARSVPFRLFPVLDQASLDALSTCAAGGSCGQYRLATYASVEGALNRQIVRTNLDFSDAAPEATAIQVHLERPDTSSTDETASDLAAGAETTLSGLATYELPNDTAGEVTATVTITYAAGQGTNRPTVTSSVTTPVEPANAPPDLAGAIEPAAITEGTATPALVTTVPRGLVGDGIVQLVQVTAGGDVPASVLRDDGTGGDLVAEDGAYSAEVTIPASSADVVYALVATIDGAQVRGSEFRVAVMPPGAPTTLAAQSVAPPISDSTGTATFVSNEALIGIDPHLDTSAAYAAAKSAAEVVGGQVAGYLPTSEIWQLRIPTASTQTDLNGTLEQLASQPHVIATEPNGINNISAVTPNDPLWSQQWGPRRTRTDETWILERGAARPVTVAVIDTGVKAAHPDLAGKVVGGWNFVNNNSDYTDRNGHGTHVAGIIAASADNGKGVTGGCWGCRILAERVMPDSGHGGDDLHIAAGISHAVAHGASVLNLSIGGADRSEAVVKALADAYYTNRVVVAAAGNNGSSKKIYPGAYDVETFTSWFGLFPRTYYVPNLTVAATTSADKRADRSNFGNWVDIAAPGVGILSSVTNPNNLSEDYPACTNTDYCQLDGTSQATPQVAAAAALMRANNPKLDESVVRQRIRSTAKPLPDKSIGSGLLDTFSAIVNSGFDTGTLQDWASTGTASVISALGPIRPVDGTLRMARASTGPGGAVVSSTLKRSLKVLPGSGDIVVRLKYNYVTEEYPEFVGSQFNDDLTITLVTPDGTRIPLAFESVNTTGWTPISGINFPGGDATVGQSGWKSVTATIPGIQLEGASSFTVEISDRGDGIFDSEAILDGLRLA